MPSKTSPLPWEHDFRKDEHGDDIPVLLDAEGKVIADAFNSDLACLHDEADEDGVRRWDEQGSVNFKFIVEAVNSHAALAARVAELEKERNIQKAHSALRGRILQEVRDKLGPLLMGLEDEGDRIYLGSTNDKDWLTEVEETIFEVDDEVWATLNREEADPYRDLYDLRVNRLPALEAEIAAKDSRLAELEAALNAYIEADSDTGNPNLSVRQYDRQMEKARKKAIVALNQGGGNNG